MKSLCYILIRSKKAGCLAAFALVFFLSCQKTETFQSMKVNELVPLEVGKFITYRLDSLVFTNSGKKEEIHSYRVKHLIERKSTDNQNRPTWVVATFITDSLEHNPWVQNGTYTVTPVENGLEVTENNLRVLRLKLPIKTGHVWKGNSYLPDRPFNPYFPISIDINLNLWEFKYSVINATEQIGTTTLADVTTVFHIDSVENVPMITDTNFASKELSLEKYAKNIGLVYKEFFLWENQPNPHSSGNPPVITYKPVRIGFGIKMWMVDRN